MRAFARLFTVALCAAAVSVPAARARAADAAAPAVQLALDGAATHGATLRYGSTVPLQIDVPAGKLLLVRALSDEVDVAFDVRDGDTTYASDSPAYTAGTEYLAFEAAPVARRVDVVLRSDPADGGSGRVAIELIGAGHPDAAIAVEWASLSRSAPAARDDGQTQARIVRLETLLPACAMASHPRCTADAQLALGALYDASDRSDAILPTYAAAIASYAGLQAPLGEIAGRFQHGERLHRAGDLAAAEADYARCAALASQHGLVFREAQSENLVAGIRHYAGDLDAAFLHYERARRTLGDVRVPLAAFLRSNIGGVHEMRGDAERALAAFQDAVDFAGDDPAMRTPRALALSNLGALRADLGQKQEAIALLSEALGEFRVLRSTRDEARTLAILGYQYQMLGRPALAEPLLRAAAATCARDADADCSAFVQLALALFLKSEQRRDEAAVAFAEAARLLGTTGSNYTRVKLLPELADFQLAGGELAAATATLDAVDTDPRLRQMISLVGRANLIRGRVLAASGDTVAARALLEEVAGRAKSDGPDLHASRAAIALARIDAGEKNWAEVERRAGAEIENIGKVRQEFYDPLRRADFLGVRQEAFELLIQAKLARAAAGDPAALREAFDVDERSRSRGLLDALATEDAAARSGDPALLAARNALRLKQRALQDKQASASAGDAAAIEALRGEVAVARVALEALEGKRAAGTRRAALAEPHTIDDVQAQLSGPHQAVLMYRLRDESHWMWVVTRDTLARVDLPTRAVLEPRIDAFVAAVREGRDAEADGRWLYDTLVGAAGLPDAVREVLVVPDGPLQRLPFVALTAPDGRYLIESLQLSMLPSTSVGIALANAQRAPRDYPAQDVVVFADPVFALDDPRVRRTGADTMAVNTPVTPLADILGADLMRNSRGLDGLTRLPGTAREADAMQAAFGATRTRVFEGFDATLDAARGEVARSARILHFATHGLVDPVAPELTGLALTRWQERGTPVGDDDGFLNLPMIGDLRFNAELVILSACDTAIGRDVASEGLIGVSRGFLAAGAGSVIATLWPVSDRDAARLDAVLASSLYGGASPAEALRVAQRDAIADPQRRRPRSWAAFGFYGALRAGDFTY